MASSFADLYSDYMDKIKAYVEQLDVTPQQFMRDLTRGMQKFQRETEYIEALVQLNRDANGKFISPDDVLRILEIRDADGHYILPQAYDQFVRNIDKWETGYLETPSDFTLRTTYSTFAPLSYNQRILPGSVPGGLKQQRIWALRATEILIFPEYTGSFIQLLYIPDIHAFSQSSSQWSAWFAAGAFDNLFNGSVINPIIAPYEDAFVKYAIMEFIRAKGSANYRVYEQEFWVEVERAKVNKPIYNREMVADYFFAPYS